jgi:hypothetical protein
MDLAALTLSTMDPTRRTSLRLPARLLADLDVLALVRGTTRDAQLARLLGAALGDAGPPRLGPPPEVATVRVDVALPAWQIRSLVAAARAAGMGHGAACAAMIGPLARRLALAEPLVRGRLGYLAVLSLEASLREAAGPAAGA